MRKSNYPKDVQNVLSIAHVVRENIKPFIYKHSGIFTMSFGGACGISSYIVYRVCRKLGIKNIQFAEGSYKHFGHAFNIYNGYIIDITATQFLINKNVYVIKHNEKSPYKIRRKNKSAVSNFKGWCYELTPEYHRQEIEKIIRKTTSQLRNGFAN